MYVTHRNECLQKRLVFFHQQQESGWYRGVLPRPFFTEKRRGFFIDEADKDKLKEMDNERAVRKN